MPQKRAPHYNLTVGTLPPGPKDKITDVPGVTVGHQTLANDQLMTGVTVVMPCAENPFYHRLPAAVCIYNGFGKTLGLMQLTEMGTLETPIALTNTLNVGLVHDAMVSYMLERCAKDGFPAVTSINPIVCECCDGFLNHIQARGVHKEHVFAAIAAADDDFDEGDVGAGKGTVCHGFKGGIGSASRCMEVAGKTYTMGVLVQTNHGRMADLTIGGVNVGAALAHTLQNHTEDKGSAIVILATDLPLDSRQLARVAKRAAVGLARLGSYVGHGSGEVFLAFSTANAHNPQDKEPLRSVTVFHEEGMDLPFRAAGECTEEAVLNSLLTAHTTTGWQGHVVPRLLTHWQPPK